MHLHTSLKRNIEHGKVYINFKKKLEETYCLAGVLK